MPTREIKVKAWNSAGNIVPKTQTIELNKDTAFNLQGLGVDLNFIGKIIEIEGGGLILINEEDSISFNIIPLTQGDDFTIVQDSAGRNLNFWESEESFPAEQAPVTHPPTNRAGESKQGPAGAAGADAGGWGFLAGGRKKKKRKTKRRKRKRRRKKSTKRRRRKTKTKRRRKRRR